MTIQRAALFLGALLPVLTPPVLCADDSFFESRVRPVLAGKCFRCHGGQRTASRLRVDSREALLKGGRKGPAVIPGDPQASLLIRAIHRHEDDAPAMPPDQPLPAEAVAALETWIKAGAGWPAAAAARNGFAAEQHWAFAPVRAVRPPEDLRGRARHLIDRFLEARMQERGVEPQAAADRRTLLRRVTFDLTGLPPSPAEMDAFLGDSSPQAFGRVVDRLLASPHYGERWGRHWLDVVRYADTAGETADYPVPQAWRYRNYVIDAFNHDKPYDEFLREQIAGDLLAARLPADAPADRYAELVVATGYLSLARRFGFDIVSDFNLTLDDTLDTLGKSVLGLTVGCARCHDHKYDPIAQADYYALYGIFESTRYPFPGCEKVKTPHDLVPLVPPARMQKHLARLDHEPQAKQRREQLLASLPTAYAVAEGQPHNARIHERGDPATRGAEVPRRFLKVLGGQTVAPRDGSGRLQLAGWLTAPSNPLTARVMVNRIWQHHFGVGLVKTPNDFGTRGAPPSHPELLDWLAGRFIDSGWSIKAMHRLILLSDAYQRAGRAEGHNQLLDPDNTLLWRFNRRRLSAEEIRDAMLATSGDLERTPGGPHPFPAEKTWGFTQHAPFTAAYDHNRRSVYLMTQRIKRHPFLALFDGADASSSTGERTLTTVPTQALFFLNDPFVHARSASLARRLMSCADDSQRLEQAFRLLLGRSPHASEQQATARFLDSYAKSLADVPAAQRHEAAWSAWLRVLLGSNEFLYVD